MPNASISLPTAHTMASIDPVSSSTFQGRRDKWYTTHDTSSTRSPFENDVLFGQIHTNTRKHACPTRSSALNELKHTRNTNQVVCVSIFRQETRYTTRAPRHPPFENYVLFGQMHAINGVLTRTSDVLICQLHEHTKSNRQKRNLKCIRARACGAAHDTSTSRHGPCWGGCYESGHSVKLLEVKRTLNTKDRPIKGHFFQFIAHIISFFYPPQNSHPN